MAYVTLGTTSMHTMVDVGQAATQVASTGLSMQMQSMQMAFATYYANENIALAQEGMWLNAGLGGAGIASGIRV